MIAILKLFKFLYINIMSVHLKKIEFKRMLKKYESSLEDFGYLKEMSHEINSEFNAAISSKKRMDLFENKEVEKLAKNKKKPKENPDRDPLFKKLFRKIVVLCHPDRMDPNLSIKKKVDYIDFYENANKANDENNMALLITVAIKLEIELSDTYLEHIENISMESDKVQKDIENIQASIAWQWYHSKEGAREIMIDQYIKHMEKILFSKQENKKKILGIGHPRTGTGYTHKIMQSWGLDINHETMGKDGIVAWQLIDKKGPWLYINSIAKDNTYEYEYVIYNVRNPFNSIPSIIFTENNKVESVEYRNKLLNTDLGSFENRVESAITSILAYDKIVTSTKPNFIFRIEDQSLDLFNALKEKGYPVVWNDKEINKIYNNRNHEGWENLTDEFKNVNPSLKKKINTFCIKYGYNPIF
jgi:hypothetical protein